MHIEEMAAPSPAPNSVAIATGHARYDAPPPYAPETAYPEYPLAGRESLAPSNQVYHAVRESLRLLGLDSPNYGSKHWNPLRGIVRPGYTVLLKPNFVRDFRETQTGLDDCVITHGSIIRAVVDYVYIALGGRGRIIIADAPQNDADFAAIRRLAGLDEIQEFYRRQANFNIEVCDLRPEQAEKVDGIITGHVPLPGDPQGYVNVDLGRHSMFAEIEHLCHLLYGSEYDTEELRSHHQGGRHEYLASKTVLAADCVINLPKLKTHKKTGITVCLKNLVGINGNKNWLPHHREGTPAQGGDQFADDRMLHRAERRVVAGFKRVFPFLGPLRRFVAKPLKAAGECMFGDTNTDAIRSGNWHGNDTTWRMVIDLNRILLYADVEGNLHDRPVRHVFNIVDGIVGGEGNGPLDPTPKPAGVVLAGVNPVAIDLVAAKLMGFDWQRVPMLFRAMADHRFPLASFAYEEITIRSHSSQFDGRLSEFGEVCLAFEPHFGWKGQIECCRANSAECENRACAE